MEYQVSLQTVGQEELVSMFSDFIMECLYELHCMYNLKQPEIGFGLSAKETTKLPNIQNNMWRSL